MAYCTPDQVIKGYEEEMRQRAPDGAGGIDLTRFDDPIERATRTVNRYLGGRKVLPADAAEVSDLAADIARYYLYTQGRPDHIKDDFNNAIATLKAMAKGDQALADATGTVAESSALVVVESAGNRMFGQDDGLF
jgi:phage gp36-like protein